MIDETQVEKVREQTRALTAQIDRRIVGHDGLVRGVLACLFAGGHVLLEGVPGLGKTLLVKTLGDVLELDFARIQCTPDLMPADIIGTQMVVENENGGRVFEFRPGPVFTQLLLTDEVNRATPKTQSALLEAMEEKAVTVGRERHTLASPFMVLATQNPIEMEGTYPLPEAQLDRFMFNVVIDYLPEDDEVAVVQRTTTSQDEPINPLFNADDILRFNELVRKVPIAEDLTRHAVRLAAASRPRQQGTPEFIDEWVSWGAGLRAGQFLVLGAKARALLQGRAHVTPEDLRALAHPVLRHRILVNYRAEAEGMTTGKVIDRLLETVTPDLS